MPETVYIPVRREVDGEEFVHLQGTSFRREEAEAQARSVSGEWAKRNPLVRIGAFTMTEVGQPQVSIVAPAPAVPPSAVAEQHPARRRQGDGSRAWDRGLVQEDARAAR